MSAAPAPNSLPSLLSFTRSQPAGSGFLPHALSGSGKAGRASCLVTTTLKQC